MEQHVDEISWDAELASLLGRLSAAQEQLLKLLSRRREMLLERDHEGLASLLPEEQRLCGELQSCHDRRRELLVQAEQAGLPSDSIRALAGALPEDSQQTLKQPLDESARRAHLVRHQCVAQWVAVQRTMLHLSHMVEIIATGGQGQPTYENGPPRRGNAGALIDQAV